MREIKFRVYDSLMQKMRPWEVIKNHLRLKALNGEVSEAYEHYSSFMQYTGLKDKNGKELYFDDYINFIYGHRRHRLVWGIRDFSDLAGLIYEIDERGAHFEIVGNVYENPELSEVIR